MNTSLITEATESDFDRRILNSTDPVLVEFFATWCGNCRRLAPLLDELAAGLSDRATFVRVNVETSPELAERYRVQATPTLLRFEGGEPTARLVGAGDERAIRGLIMSAPGEAAPPSSTEPSWVPVDACGLPASEQPLRIAAFEDFFASAVRAVDRVEPTRLHLGLDRDPAVAARAAALAVAESDCCSFFTFTLTAVPDALTLEVEVPEDMSAVLDGLTEQARTAGAAA